MTPELQTSYAHCRHIARRATSSFYLSFLVLPPAQRNGMYALYAFLRQTDDIADGDAPTEHRRRELALWRQRFDGALQGDGDNAVLSAIADTMQRFAIPPNLLHDAITGAEMDLDLQRYRTFADLEHYCYCVASVVGLACLRIWGCRDARADELASKCGLAFQLTNILRDVAEDAYRGRIYLPQEDLARFGCRETDILQNQFSTAVARLMQFESRRTEELYREATELERYLPRDGCRAWRMMLITYHEILREITTRNYNVFGPPIRLSRWRRALLAARGLFGGSLAQSLPERASMDHAAAKRRIA